MHPLTLHEPGGLTVEVLETGATLHRVRVPVGTAERDVVLSLPPAERARSRDFLGASIGRYANRIGGGRFELDGREHLLPRNDRGNTLHGGDGFAGRPWTVVARSRSRLELSLVSWDGDQGFPGRLEVRCTFEVCTVDGAATLRTSYGARADAATVVNLTSHPYYNLDGACPPVMRGGQRLSVPADHYAPVDQTGLPTGELACVAGTSYDLRGAVRVRSLPAIDHSYVVPGTGLRQVASMASASGDLALELWSDQPAVHVYTGSALGSADPRHPQPGSGVALEPQHLPDSVHHPEWPSTVLRPGEEYAWVSEARFLPG